MIRFMHIGKLNIRIHWYPDKVWAIRTHYKYIGFAVGKYYIVFDWN